MINNYEYFLVLAQELNISRAAERLFISHQALSGYIKNLEKAYNIKFFNTKPKLTLTPAGEIMLESLKKINLIEKNLSNQLSDLTNNDNLIITIGLTEGRYRILTPILFKKYRSVCPKIQLNIIYDTSINLMNKLLNSEIDIFLSGSNIIKSNKIQFKPILKEKLYLVITDTMLEKYFPDSYPQCKDIFLKGVDLRYFQEVPFILNKKGYNSRTIIDNHLKNINAKLNVIMEFTQPDIHHLLSSVDYGASFCLPMYIHKIKEINILNSGVSKINIFPILNLTETNTFSLMYLKDAIFSKSALVLMDLIKDLCIELSSNEQL